VHQEIIWNWVFKWVGQEETLKLIKYKRVDELVLSSNINSCLLF